MAVYGGSNCAAGDLVSLPVRTTRPNSTNANERFAAHDDIVQLQTAVLVGWLGRGSFYMHRWQGLVQISFSPGVEL
jgi:hypothetical protein